MRRLALVLLILGLVVAGAAWWLSRPTGVAPARLAAIAAHDADPEAGALVFHAGGCASCHAGGAGAGAEAGQGPVVLAGGARLETPFGTFAVPNISTDPDRGIGAWSLDDFATAMLRGVSPEGRHYYPAFPYTAYARMTDADIADLWAYLRGLPASDRANAANALAFPYSLRRGVGLWKRLHLRDDWVTPAPSEHLARGRYLVEALAHCAECHTPRGPTGGLDMALWMAGAENPSGRGRIPNITPAALDWSADDIAYYLETGFTPAFDSAGGTMAAVIRNTARLPAADRAAIAAYAKGRAPIADR